MACEITYNNFEISLAKYQYKSCYCLYKIILCPVNFSSWGNLLNNALSKAVEKAMESDVEYRRGLPFNLSSFMGSGVVGTLFVQLLDN